MTGGDAPCWEGEVDDQRDRQVGVRPDLGDRTQVHHLVVAFYREVALDPVLAPVFSEVAEVDWAEHIPKLIDYWCWILHGTDRYPGAVTRTHRELHQQEPIRLVHCDRWFELWTACVDERWAGPIAERATSHAAALMAGMAKHVFGLAWEPPGAVATGRSAPVGTAACSGRAAGPWG